MSRNPVTRQVRRAYRQDTLARILTMPEQDFGSAFGMQTVQTETRWSRQYSGQPEDYYHFRDNGARVLATAHLDTVVAGDRRAPRFRNTKAGPLVTSGALDDRLGAYVILDLLPRLGVTCDWLLTVGEESGASTAEYFKPGKDYDWAIEFDRTGTDVVMYQYEDAATRRLVEAAGARTGSGSFSDIAYLEHLGVKAFNWGVGYRGNYHSEAGYAYLYDTFAMVARYLRFCEQNAGTTLPHDPGYGYGTGRRNWQDDADYLLCDECIEYGVDESGYCRFCGTCMDCGLPEDDGCMCYVPKHVRDEMSLLDTVHTRGKTAGAKAAGDWKQLSWDEYLDQRPSTKNTDDLAAPGDGQRAAAYEAGLSAARAANATNHIACIMASGSDQHGAHHHGDDPAWWTQRYVRRSPSIAPPWSEHAPERLGHAPGRFSAIGDAVRIAILHPDDPEGWHEAATGLDDAYVIAHVPAYRWAAFCKRCAARWPTAAGSAITSADIHPAAGPVPSHLASSNLPDCMLCAATLAEAENSGSQILAIEAPAG